MTEQNTPPKGLGPLVYSIELRDLFAMAALVMMRSDPILVVGAEVWAKRENKTMATAFAWMAYEQADAMIAARKETRRNDVPAAV